MPRQNCNSMAVFAVTVYSVFTSLHRTAVVRITLSAPPTGKRKQYDQNGDEMKYGRME